MKKLVTHYGGYEGPDCMGKLMVSCGQAHPQEFTDDKDKVTCLKCRLTIGTAFTAYVGVRRTIRRI